MIRKKTSSYNELPGYHRSVAIKDGMCGVVDSRVAQLLMMMIHCRAGEMQHIGFVDNRSGGAHNNDMTV